MSRGRNRSNDSAYKREQHRSASPWMFQSESQRVDRTAAAYDPLRDPPLQHADLTAAIMRDPPIGRRAIDAVVPRPSISLGKGHPRYGAKEYPL